MPIKEIVEKIIKHDTKYNKTDKKIEKFLDECVEKKEHGPIIEILDYLQAEFNSLIGNVRASIKIGNILKLTDIFLLTLHKISPKTCIKWIVEKVINHDARQYDEKIEQFLTESREKKEHEPVIEILDYLQEEYSSLINNNKASIKIINILGLADTFIVTLSSISHEVFLKWSEALLQKVETWFQTINPENIHKAHNFLNLFRKSCISRIAIIESPIALSLGKKLLDLESKLKKFIKTPNEILHEDAEEFARIYEFASCDVVGAQLTLSEWLKAKGKLELATEWHDKARNNKEVKIPDEFFKHTDQLSLLHFEVNSAKLNANLVTYLLKEEQKKGCLFSKLQLHYFVPKMPKLGEQYTLTKLRREVMTNESLQNYSSFMAFASAQLLKWSRSTKLIEGVTQTSFGNEDHKLGLSWLRKAAQKTSGGGALFLFCKWWYTFTDLFKPNEIEHWRLLLEEFTASASSGHAISQYYVGTLLTAFDIPGGLDWIAKAAKSGYPFAEAVLLDEKIDKTKPYTFPMDESFTTFFYRVQTLRFFSELKYYLHALFTKDLTKEPYIRNVDSVGSMLAIFFGNYEDRNDVGNDVIFSTLKHIITNCKKENISVLVDCLPYLNDEYIFNYVNPKNKPKNIPSPITVKKFNLTKELLLDILNRLQESSSTNTLIKPIHALLKITSILIKNEAFAEAAKILNLYSEIYKPLNILELTEIHTQLVNLFSEKKPQKKAPETKEIPTPAPEVKQQKVELSEFEEKEIKAKEIKPAPASTPEPVVKQAEPKKEKPKKEKKKAKPKVVSAPPAEPSAPAPEAPKKETEKKPAESIREIVLKYLVTNQCNLSENVLIDKIKKNKAPLTKDIAKVCYAELKKCLPSQWKKLQSLKAMQLFFPNVFSLIYKESELGNKRKIWLNSQMDLIATRPEAEQFSLFSTAILAILQQHNAKIEELPESQLQDEVVEKNTILDKVNEITTMLQPKPVVRKVKSPKQPPAQKVEPKPEILAEKKIETVAPPKPFNPDQDPTMKRINLQDLFKAAAVPLEQEIKPKVELTPEIKKPIVSALVVPVPETQQPIIVPPILVTKQPEPKEPVIAPAPEIKQVQPAVPVEPISSPPAEKKAVKFITKPLDIGWIQFLKDRFGNHGTLKTHAQQGHVIILTGGSAKKITMNIAPTEQDDFDLLTDATEDKFTHWCDQSRHRKDVFFFELKKKYRVEVHCVPGIAKEETLLDYAKRRDTAGSAFYIKLNDILLKDLEELKKHPSVYIEDPTHQAFESLKEKEVSFVATDIRLWKRILSIDPIKMFRCVFESVRDNQPINSHAELEIQKCASMADPIQLKTYFEQNHPDKKADMVAINYTKRLQNVFEKVFIYRKANIDKYIACWRKLKLFQALFPEIKSDHANAIVDRCISGTKEIKNSSIEFILTHFAYAAWLDNPSIQLELLVDKYNRYFNCDAEARLRVINKLNALRVAPKPAEQLQRQPSPAFAPGDSKSSSPTFFQPVYAGYPTHAGYYQQYQQQSQEFPPGFIVYRS